MKTQTCGISKKYHSFDFLCDADFSDLARAHENKEDNWTMTYLRSAYDNYRINRENGEAQDNPPGEFKYDGTTKWILQKDYYVKYTEGPNDKLWMDTKDLNYLTRLVREGTLEQIEPTWRDVLSAWEPESKRVTAIARVETEIKAHTEAETKKQTTEKPKPI